MAAPPPIPTWQPPTSNPGPMTGPYVALIAVGSVVLSSHAILVSWRIGRAKAAGESPVTQRLPAARAQADSEEASSESGTASGPADLSSIRAGAARSSALGNRHSPTQLSHVRALINAAPGFLAAGLLGMLNFILLIVATYGPWAESKTPNWGPSCWMNGGGYSPYSYVKCWQAQETLYQTSVCSQIQYSYGSYLSCSLMASISSLNSMPHNVRSHGNQSTAFTFLHFCTWLTFIAMIQGFMAHQQVRRRIAKALGGPMAATDCCVRPDANGSCCSTSAVTPTAASAYNSGVASAPCPDACDCVKPGGACWCCCDPVCFGYARAVYGLNSFICYLTFLALLIGGSPFARENVLHPPGTVPGSGPGPGPKPNMPPVPTHLSASFWICFVCTLLSWIVVESTARSWISLLQAGRPELLKDITYGVIDKSSTNGAGRTDGGMPGAPVLVTGPDGRPMWHPGPMPAPYTVAGYPAAGYPPAGYPYAYPAGTMVVHVPGQPGAAPGVGAAWAAPGQEALPQGPPLAVPGAAWPAMPNGQPYPQPMPGYGMYPAIPGMPVPGLPAGMAVPGAGVGPQGAGAPGAAAGAGQDRQEDPEDDPFVPRKLHPTPASDLLARRTYAPAQVQGPAATAGATMVAGYRGTTAVVGNPLIALTATAAAAPGAPAMAAAPPAVPPFQGHGAPGMGHGGL